MDVDGWEETAEILSASGRPWPMSAATFDLRWHVDQQKPLPGRTELKRRWNWKVEEHVKRLLSHPERWWDPTKGEPPRSRRELEEHCPVRKRAPQVTTRSPQVTPGDPRSPMGEPGESSENHQVTPGDPRSPQVTSIARTSPHPTPSPSPEEGARAREPSPAPRWTAGWPGNEPMAVLSAVAAIAEAIRQKPVLADRLGGDAALVRGLWDTLGRPPLRELVGEAEVVAAWAREGPSAGNDLRGVNERGESWGADRSRSPSTLLKPALWHDRLDQALAWDQAGRPTLATGPPTGASAPRDEPTEARTPEQEADADEFWRDPDAYIRLHGSHTRAK